MSLDIDLVMIARDEARCVARALDSVRPWVSRMWVLDTGSKDATVDIAQAHGAQVRSHVWKDDFAEARNAALALSQAPWRLVLDADEWLAGNGQALQALRHMEPSFVGQVQVVNQFDAPGGLLQESPAWLSRIVPTGALYEGRVHEQPQLHWPRQRLDVRLLHDGYRQAQSAHKIGRNHRLLQAALAQQPHNAYLQYQLGKDHEVQGRFAQALPCFVAAQAGVQATDPWRHDLVLRQLFTLKKLGQHEQALNLAAQEMPHWPHSPDFYFALGDVLLDWAASDAQRGSQLLPMIESAWLKALEIGENPQLQDSVRGRGSYLAAHNLAVLHGSLGDEQAARCWREREAQLRV